MIDIHTDTKNIRNFSIIAHIDHGKSTLADRMLEITETVSARDMQEQVLDSMELERERGITIKMTPAVMKFQKDGEDLILNLIDTPGHIDFRYEVSRALRAVEGAILIVDATQGVQAQTLTTLEMAQDAGIVIIPAVSKVDSPLAMIDEVKLEIAEILDCDPDTILEVSGKTGEGVQALLESVVDSVPAPVYRDVESSSARALIFDFEYSSHRGVIVYIRMLDGEFKKGDSLTFLASSEKFQILEIGIFSPAQVPTTSLTKGTIGYIVTGIKKAGVANVGDTLTTVKNPLEAFPGYTNPNPVVWASVYPEDADEFDELRLALSRLQLSDSSISFEEEISGVLGRGFRVGLLGMLHLEIVTERLRREFNLTLIVTSPSITYQVKVKGGEIMTVYSPHLFPQDGSVVSVQEPWVELSIMVPEKYVGDMMQILFSHEGEVMDSQNFGDKRMSLTVHMPLRELMRNFFDELKSVSSGFASVSYEDIGLRDADVVRMDILVAEEEIAAFTRIISRRRIQEESEELVEKLYKLLPRQQFVVKIQARVSGRIISSRTLKAFRKDVTAKLYGGDITRKRKLLEKQKKGKKKRGGFAKVDIPQDVFLKVMKK
ncbi:MAG: GTP-binding protein LepA [Flavobacteriaceae bacterium]|jgi:GTP-binding protein LepA